MRLRSRWILAPLLLLLAPTPAGAQACLGRGIGGLAGHAVVGQAAYASYDLGDRADGADLGAALWGNPRGLVAYSAGYTRRFMNGSGPDLDVAGAMLSAELPRIPLLPPGAGACVTVGGAGAWAADAPPGTELESYSLPLGLAVGLTVPAGPISRLYPYLHPRLVLARADGAAFGFDVEERYTAFALEGGLGFARGPLVGRVRILFGARPDGVGISPLPDLLAGLEAGIRF